ncbi:zinc ribbon domain-containing protein [Candidatus Bathyarchaeota archaeon]|nr:zinc ribbon domain-containing protein [Candidatus Bathyarchaeota archaeon]MBS7628381.1 zinc ribbon domain-containing protein [Candidatus Bathyarchaeota archaeon]
MVKQCSSCGAANRDDATFCSSCGASFAAPAVKPVPSVKVVRPAVPSVPYRVPPPGMCYYHPNLPAQYICSRCGRAICRDDARFYGDLVLCPQCYAGIVPVTVPTYPTAYPTGYPTAYPAQYPAPPPTPTMPMGAPMGPPPAIPGPPPGMVPVPFLPPRPSALWGFILSLVAGIVTIIAGAAATAILYANLPLVPAWLAPYWLAFLGVGLLLGLVVVLGSFLIRLGYTTLGGIIAFVFSLANIYLALLIMVPTTWVYLPIAAGIVALVLGMVGGILGILGK